MTVDLSTYKVATNEVSSSTKFDNLVQAVQDALNALPASQISGYPADATKFLRGDATWATIGGTWTSYTPALTGGSSNPTIGTGPTQHGRYIQIGKLVMGAFRVVMGTGFVNGTGQVEVSLPIAAAAVQSDSIGSGSLVDVSTAQVVMVHGFLIGASKARFRHSNTGAFESLWTSPFAFADSDEITCTFLYEAA